jgi:hypothetical protein
MDPAVGRQADLARAAGGIARGAFARDAGAQVLQRRGVELGEIEPAVAGKPAAADMVRHDHFRSTGPGQGQCLGLEPHLDAAASVVYDGFITG